MNLSSPANSAAGAGLGAKGVNSPAVPALLVVEADALVREAMTQIFQNDFTVSVCDCGPAALDVLGKSRH